MPTRCGPEPCWVRQILSSVMVCSSASMTAMLAAMDIWMFSCRRSSWYQAGRGKRTNVPASCAQASPLTSTQN